MISEGPDPEAGAAEWYHVDGRAHPDNRAASQGNFEFPERSVIALGSGPSGEFKIRPTFTLWDAFSERTR
jgi:hypothetical protein